MAYSIRISTYSGYPTQTAMRVSVEFTVVAAGQYTSRYELYDEGGNIIATAQGVTDNMSANSSSSDYHSDFYKTFTGLESGATYGIVAYLVNVSTGADIATSNEIWFTTKSPSLSILQLYSCESHRFRRLTDTSFAVAESAKQDGETRNIPNTVIKKYFFIFYKFP